MSQERNAAVVGGVYEAFGRGDIPAVLAALHDDVEWDVFAQPTAAQEAGIEYLLPRHGREAVGAFFAALAPLEFHGFGVGDIIASGNRVAVEITTDIEVRATGKRFQDLEIHLWTLDDDGRVTHLQHVMDTAKHIAAHTA